jgi:hypothetical protein
VAGDSSEYNYASGRLDHQSYHKSVRVERAHTETVFLSRILRDWWSEAVLIEGYLPQEARSTKVDLRREWQWDGFGHVDPVKEADAQNIRLNESRVTNLAIECAQEGRDWDTVLKQRVKEEKRLRDLRRQEGLSDETPSGAAEMDSRENARAARARRRAAAAEEED